MPVSLMHMAQAAGQMPACAAVMPGATGMPAVSTMQLMQPTAAAAMTYYQQQQAQQQLQQQQQQQQQLQHQQQQQQQDFNMTNGHGGCARPSRSLSSASPPGMGVGGSRDPLAGTPTPSLGGTEGGLGSNPEDRNPDYLKELQAEKERLEAVLAAETSSVLPGGENNNENSNLDSPNSSNNNNQDNTTTATDDENPQPESSGEENTVSGGRTSHVIKLLEQGKLHVLFFGTGKG